MKHLLSAPLVRSAAASALVGVLASGCGTPEGESSGATTASTADAGSEDRTAQGPEAFKLSVPQNDLDVTVDGFSIIPPMGMGSWIAFAPTGEADEMLAMGDIVVREEEIGEIQRELVGRGLTVTALHNHFVRESPPVMYMHIRGAGPRDSLRSDVEAVLGRVEELRGMDPSAASAEEVVNTLDTNTIAEILGHSGEMTRGVYKVTIGRPDVRLTSGGVEVTTDMGFNTWVAWQGTPQRAAVAGDFVMLEDEVAPVIEALVTNGIEVVAVHNHMVREEPRVFFLHYWATGPAQELARGLRAALDRTGS